MALHTMECSIVTLNFKFRVYKMNKYILRAAVIFALSAGPGNAATILISEVDDFSTGGMNVNADGSDTVVASGAIGGYRTVSMTKVGNFGANADVYTSLGIYAHNAGANTSAISTITWDANGGGLGGLDWSTGYFGQTFDLDIVSIDQGFVDLTLLVEDTFASLKKTCRKHDLSFWDYLKDRLLGIGDLSNNPKMISHAFDRSFLDWQKYLWLSVLHHFGII